MANKILTGLMVLVLIIAGGAGYYSFTLNQQIEDLNQQVASLEAGQLAKVDDVLDELSTFQIETNGNISRIDSDISTVETDISDALDLIDTAETNISGALDKIGTVEDTIGQTKDQITSLEEKASQTESQIASLQDSLGETQSQVSSFQDQLAEFSVTTVAASDVYDSIADATVMVTNGDSSVTGSGVIYDTQGHVITAFHVVDGQTSINVVLHDGRVYTATDIGHSVFSDIAVLKLSGNPGIEPPLLADSSKIKVGDAVFSLGAPLGWRDTFTSGIVSQVNRATEYGTGYTIANLIQFDAPVNSGNSGGPLFNTQSELIGISVARIDPTEGDGIYWAVSSNKVKRLAAAIIAKGYFDYPWIGIGAADLIPQSAQDLGLNSINGVLVTDVSSGGPAQAAGIQINDVIVAMDGVTFRDFGDLTSYLGELLSPGDVSRISIIRGSTTLELSITIGTRQ